MSNIYKSPVIRKSFLLKPDLPVIDKKENEKPIDEDEEKKKLMDAIAKEAYQKGWLDALSKNQEDVKILCQGLKKAIFDLKNETEIIWEKSEKEIIRLALAVAKKLVHEEISQNGSKITAKIVSEALNKVKKNNILKILVNPADFEKLTEMKINMFSDHNGDCEIISDNDISRGGCKVETDYGCVDARLETRWGEVISVFEEQHLETEDRKCHE